MPGGRGAKLRSFFQYVGYPTFTQPFDEGGVTHSIGLSHRFYSYFRLGKVDHSSGIDIRDYGSGNAGATNTFRVLGSRMGDPCHGRGCAKGRRSHFSLYIFIPYYLGNPEAERTNFMVWFLGLAAVTEHISSLFGRSSSGGKGGSYPVRDDHRHTAPGGEYAA